MILITDRLKEQVVWMNPNNNAILIKITLVLILCFAIETPTQAQPALSPAPSEVVWGDKKDQLNQSYKRWLKLKEECNGNYCYNVKWSSWTGFGNTTTIVVRGNQIIERRFESYGAPHPDGRPIDKNRWTERGDFIGSNPKGHPPRTIDDLYKEAKTLTGRPIPKFHKGVIRLNKEGLLLSCFIQDNRIADDAPIKGINITSISLGSEKSPNEKQLKPTFEQWVASGKKLPEGMMFIGGSPWFNETTGKKREPIEVYEMIYGKKEKPAPAKPIRPLFNPNKRKPFPQHWGDPPKRQTRDLRPLPGGYGMGSGTLANWIQKNLDRDKDRSNQPD